MLSRHQRNKKQACKHRRTSGRQAGSNFSPTLKGFWALGMPWHSYEQVLG